MTLWAQLALALAIFAAGAGSGWQVRAWKAGADAREQAEVVVRDAARRAEHVDTSATVFEQQQAARTARDRVVVQEVQRVVEKPVYRNVCLDADGLRILAADIAGSAPAGEPAPAVRGSASAADR